MSSRFTTNVSAVVTGGAQGLGRGIAERLVTEGVRVLLVDVNEQVLGETAAELGRLG